ncbi:MAG: hypothetical protein FWD01_02135 [Defluviitaleaceae bacterium]|nr:hypothetical protein [Defluviitaleaceae bacterium]
MLCNYLSVVGIDAEMIVKVLDSDNFKDIEDGLQMQCAVDSGVDYIITRDPKGFRFSKIPVLSPE